MGSRASLGAPKRRSGAAQGQQQLLGPCCWQRKSPGRGEPPKNARFVLSHPQSHRAGAGGCPGSVWPQQGHLTLPKHSSSVTIPTIGHGHRGAPSSSHPQQTQLSSAVFAARKCFPSAGSKPGLEKQQLDVRGWEQLLLHPAPRATLPFSPTHLGIVPWPLSRGASKLVFPFC